MEPKLRTVVLATDFSAGARRAMERIPGLGLTANHRVLLAHVWDESLWQQAKALFGAQLRAGALQEAAEKELAAWQAELERRAAVRVVTHLLRGSPTEEIVALARAEQADLIVLGGYGEHRLRDLLLGGTALAVLSGSPCAVLAVRRDGAGAYANVLIATDLSDTSARAVKTALALFPGASHRLLHAYQVPFESRLRMGGAGEEEIAHFRERAAQEAARRLEAFAADCGPEAAQRLSRSAVFGHPTSVIHEAVRQGAPDLLVLGRHRGSRLEERVLGSVTQHALYYAPCDLLLVP
ncbi:MAG: universal stress protein [Pseudomonadota bacterium]